MINKQLTFNDNIGLSLRKSDGTSDQLKFGVNMSLRLFDGNGVLKDSRDVKNTVTTSGLAGIMEQLLDSPTLGKATHMGIGTGTPGTNALGSEIGTRDAFDQKTRAGAVVTHVSTFGPGNGTGAITEAGIFDASTSGNMWMSASFSVVNKGAADTLVITWTLTAS